MYGRPILLMQAGRIDVIALRRRGVTTEMLVRRYVRELERVRRTIDSSAPEIAARGQLALTDIAGCTVAKFVAARRLWVEIARVGNAYFPELSRTTTGPTPPRPPPETRTPPHTHRSPLCV